MSASEEKKENNNVSAGDFYYSSPNNSGAGGRGGSINPATFTFITFIILTWLLIFLTCFSYFNFSGKYGKALEGLRTHLKKDSSRLVMIRNNTKFFGSVAKNQVNVYYLFYLLSLHRFGSIYLKSVSVKNGRVVLSALSSGKSFERSLNYMNDYALYLSIYGMPLHTGQFRVSSIKSSAANGIISGCIIADRYYKSSRPAKKFKFSR